MKIITDSAADLPPSDIQEYGITVVPQLIRFPEGEVRSDGIDPDAFYDHLQAMSPRIPTTSQPSPGMFSHLFEELSHDGDEVLAIHISSGLSGTIQSSRLAATQVSNSRIEVIDSLTLSGAQRFQVLAAAAATRAGW